MNRGVAKSHENRRAFDPGATKSSNNSINEQKRAFPSSWLRSLSSYVLYSDERRSVKNFPISLFASVLLCLDCILQAGRRPRQEQCFPSQLPFHAPGLCYLWLGAKPRTSDAIAGVASYSYRSHMQLYCSAPSPRVHFLQEEILTTKRPLRGSETP
jgi:hypothetical protein